MGQRMRGGGMVRAAGCGRGEGAGLPELKKLFQAGEDAREAGHDDRVQAAVRVRRNGGLEVGELGAQRWRLRFHSSV